MHAHPVLRQILEPSDNRGISGLDFPRLSFDRRQQGLVIKRVRHAVQLGAHIPIMDELQGFHDQTGTAILRPLPGLDRDPAHQRVALGRSDIEETGVPDRREGLGIAVRQRVTERQKGAVGIHSPPALARM